AKMRLDGYTVTVIWDEYADWAMELGNLHVARVCLEQALLVARERNIIWRIPYFTLRFGQLLIKAGNYDHLQALLADIAAYDTQASILQVLRSVVSTELFSAFPHINSQHVLNDEVFERCLNSGEPRSIAAIGYAYAKAAIADRQSPRARKYISRALGFVHRAEHAEALLALAGQYASREDASRARKLLFERTRLPNASVSRAYLELWEARAALRRRSWRRAKSHAQRAAQQFEQLGWKHDQAESLALVGIPDSTPQASIS